MKTIYLKILFIILPLFIKQLSYSQIQSFKNGNDLYEKGLFDKALVIFESIDTIKVEKNKDGDIFKFLKVFWIANCNYKLNNYEKADSLFDKAIYKCLQVYKNTDDIYYTCLHWSANCKKKLKLYDEAIIVSNKKILFHNDKNQTNNIEYINDYESLGDLYLLKEDFKKAISSYEYAITLRENQKNGINGDYVISLYNLAATYFKNASYKKAEIYYINSLKIGEKIYQNDSANLTYILIGLADLYTKTGSFELAQKYYLRATTLVKITKGEQSQDYFLTINHLSSFYIEIGEFSKAEDICIKNQNNILKYFGEKSVDFLSSINELSRLYLFTQNLDKASIYINKSIEISDQIFKINDYRRAEPIYNLATLYLYKNDVFTADTLLHKVLSLYELSLGKKHPAYNNTLRSISYVSQRIGNIRIAEDYLNEINENEKQLDSNSRTYSNSLFSLGFFYLDQGNTIKAIDFLLKADKIQEKIKSTISFSAIQTKIALSQAYLSLGQNYSALNIGNTVIENIKSTIGRNNMTYCGAMNIIAISYGNLGKYDSAIAILKEIIKIEEDRDYPDLNSLSTYYLNLTKYFLKTKQTESACETFIKSKTAINDNINQNIFQLTSIQKNKIINGINIKIDTLKSIFINNKELQKNTLGALFDLEIVKKSLILRCSNYLNNIIKSNTDSTFNVIIDKINSLKRKIITLYESKSTDYDLIKIYENKVEALEKELINYSDNAFVIKTNLNIKWRDIQKSLLPNQACVEFIGFNLSKHADSTVYGAIIIKAGDSIPAFITLFKEEELSKILLNNKNLILNKSRQDDLYSINGNGKYLYDLIWRKIDNLLNPKMEIFVSSFGLLHKLNLNALRFNVTNNELALTNTRFITSSADIVMLNKKRDVKIIKDVYIFGGINYENIDSSKLTYYIDDRGVDINSNWTYLPNTYSEGIFIDSICKVNKIVAHFYSSTEASKSKFINVSKNGKIIHIATHGYFLPDSLIADRFLNNTQTNNTNSLLLKSGLVFSGANKSISDKIHFYNDNGIMSAYDISNLNLINTDLVVLSACETGLGDIKGSEGVYGLQRSFKIAGANKIIMTLWKIPDLQTKELMMIFYKNYFDGKSAAEALQIAQATLSKRYSPYYWAAFKLLE